MSRKSWGEMVRAEMKEHGDSPLAIEQSVPPFDTPDMTRKFDAGYGTSEGCPFTVWTKTRVYFPIVYDGAEWVGSVARNPDGNATGHFGGQ